ncbi:MAG: universal stress protein [Caulobacterales bacterium]
MTYTAILTHVQPEAEAAPRLVCAHAMAKRFGARLIGLGAEMIPPLAFDNGFYTLEAEWATAMRDAISDRLKIAEKAFAAHTGGLPKQDVVWECGIQLPGPALGAASRAADLIVAGGVPHHSIDAYREVAPAELAISAGRPVLVAPPSAPPLEAKTVMVAWKDTREARRALSDAMPFLKAAEAVHVVEVCEGGDADQAKIRTDDVARALRRHGAKATATVVTHHPADGYQILRQASHLGADLIVLGCYGHSRIGEWVFGGVTRDLMSQTERYLLLSH